MPNHCATTAQILFDNKQDLDVFMTMAKHTSEEDEKDTVLTVSMEALMPTPPHLLESKADFVSEDLARAIEGDPTYEYVSWYDWRVAHWGTKWDMYSQEIDDLGYFPQYDKYGIVMRYDTAWSPNIRFWQSFSKIAPVQVDMTYLDEGWGFAGRTVIKDGCIEEFCSNLEKEELATLEGVVIDDDGNISWDESFIEDTTVIDYVIEQYDKGERTNG